MVVISVSLVVKNLFLRMTGFRRVTYTLLMSHKSSLVTSMSYRTKQFCLHMVFRRCIHNEVYSQILHLYSHEIPKHWSSKWWQRWADYLTVIYVSDIFIILNYEIFDSRLCYKLAFEYFTYFCHLCRGRNHKKWGQW